MEIQEAVTGARDRMRAEPSEVFARNILEPIFEFNCRHNFQPLLDAHRAWLTMLAEQGVVDGGPAAAILRGLDEVEQEGPDAVRPFDGAVEYFYLHVERALVGRVPGGEAVVGNLNLGRTRPEPLHRMVMRESILRVLEGALALRRTLLARAGAEVETVMPGYTHLLHAQPTTLGHYLLAVHDHLERDTRRLLAAYETTDECTLGCGALAGTSVAIDRERVRELLGFERLRENTIDSVAATDHVTETAAALAGLMTVVGRLSQDLYVWSTQEFALIDVTDAFASPSSLMPQKKNALVLEYVRSRAARSVAALTGCFAVPHNVGYMDTEEVEIEAYLPLFDAFELTEQSLPTIEAVVEAMQPNRTLMRERSSWGFSSVTALAERIQTEQDLSYRTAHRIVARAVLLAVERGRDATGIDVELVDLAAAEMIGRPLQLSEEAIRESLDPREFVDRHDVTGGPAPVETRRMVAERQDRLAADESIVAGRAATLSEARRRLRDATQRLVGTA